jgi:hypothetical protein
MYNKQLNTFPPDIVTLHVKGTPIVTPPVELRKGFLDANAVFRLRYVKEP